MLSLLITDLNPSSNEKILLAITYLTRLEMRLGELSIDYMSRVCDIAQRMYGVTIDRIIPLLEIASLDHKIYPEVKIRYLVGDTALVNCNLLRLSGIFSSKDTRQRALGISAVHPSTTSVNRVSNNNSQNERPVPDQHQPTMPSSNAPYPPSKGGILEVHSVYDPRRQVMSVVSFQSPHGFPEAQIPQRSGMPGISQARLPMPYRCHRVGQNCG